MIFAHFPFRFGMAAECFVSSPHDILDVGGVSEGDAAPDVAGLAGVLGLDVGAGVAGLEQERVAVVEEVHA